MKVIHYKMDDYYAGKTFQLTFLDIDQVTTKVYDYFLKSSLGEPFVALVTLLASSFQNLGIAASELIEKEIFLLLSVRIVCFCCIFVALKVTVV